MFVVALFVVVWFGVVCDLLCGVVRVVLFVFLCCVCALFVICCVVVCGLSFCVCVFVLACVECVCVLWLWFNV